LATHKKPGAVDVVEGVAHVVYHFVIGGEIIVGVQVALLHGHVVDVARRVGVACDQVVVAVALFQALPVGLSAPNEARRAVQVAQVRHDLQDAAVLRIVLVLRRRVPVPRTATGAADGRDYFTVT
jgi:hypothetical protein